MKIKLFFATLLVMFAAALSAQNIDVKGVVKDATTGEPVAYAYVKVAGTQNGAYTNELGEYKLRADANATLEVSLMGYAIQLVKVEKRGVVNVNLVAEAVSLDDVTVVAFGTKRKEDLVGSVSSLKKEIIDNSVQSSVTKALEGAVAGVTVISSSGQPGSDASIVVRGIGSINAGKTALIVLDGAPYNGSLSDINPADIESLTVSKDAVSNSLYGSRAANGVVLVTTKKGRSITPQITFKGTLGVNSRGVSEYNLANDPKEFYELTWYGIRNTEWASNGGNLAQANATASANLLDELGNYNSFIIPAGEQLVGTDGKLNPNAQFRYYDPFYDAMFDSSLRQEYVLSASGANDKLDYYISAGYLNEDAYVTGSSYERFTLRANVNSQLKKWLKIGMNLSYSNTQSRGVLEDAGKASNPFDVARSWAPIYPVYAYDAAGNVVVDDLGNPVYDKGTGQTAGTVSRPTAQDQNIIINLKEDIRKAKYDNIGARTYVETKFLKDFKFTMNYSYDLKMYNGLTYYTPTVGDGASFKGRGTKSTYNARTTNFNQLLSYDKTLGKHNISAMVGHESYNYDYDDLSAQKINFYDPMNPQPDNGGAMQYITGSTYGRAIEGYFVKADYNYDYKYYFSAALRRDGSSRFHKDNRWGTFWTIGGSWRISQERFMEGAKGWLNDLKIRASYGTQGNEGGIDSMSYVDQYSVSWDGSAHSLSYAYYANPDLTWEKQKTVDVGIDFKLFNRFYGSIDWFNRATSDMLFQKTLPFSSGREYKWENIGSMRNTGIELELNVDIFNKKDLKWTVTLIGSHYKNKITRLPDENRVDGITSGSQKLMEGHSLYTWYTYEFAGFDPTTGKPSWYKDVLDSEGNPTGERETTEDYNQATRYLLDKTGIPDFQGGLNTTFSWKGIDVSIATAFQIGGYAYDSQYVSTMSQSFYVSHNKDLWKTWNPETSEGKYPIWNANANTSGLTSTSTLYLTNASYFSIRNLTVGYSFPRSWMKKLGIGNIRVFCSADNLLFVSKRKGFDPRLTMSGVQSSVGGYSQMRTVTGGVQFNF